MVTRQLSHIATHISSAIHFKPQSPKAELFVGRRWNNFSSEWMWKAWETSFPWVVEHVCALWGRDVICLFVKWKPNTCCSFAAVFWGIAGTYRWEVRCSVSIGPVLFHQCIFLRVPLLLFFPLFFFSSESKAQLLWFFSVVWILSPQKIDVIGSKLFLWLCNPNV